jgi:drug/metabolite transporter (DMT)-like permease
MMLPRPLSVRFRRLDSSVRGAILMIGACAGFAAMMAIVRKVTPGVHPFEAVFFRNLLGVAFMLPWILKSGWRRLRTGRPVMHLLRAVCGLVALPLLFTAVSLMPLAEVTALSFTAPLFATVGAALILGERVRLRRWAATGVGFLGALIIIRPGIDTFAGASLIALGSAAGIAAAQLSVKALSRTEHRPDHGPVDDADVAGARRLRLDLAGCRHHRRRHRLPRPARGEDLAARARDRAAGALS